MNDNNLAIQHRIDMDLLKRSSMGIVMYAVILPAVFWPFDFHLIQPQLSYTFAAFMFAVSILRFVHKMQTSTLYRYSPLLWRSLFTLLSMSHAVVLSVYFAFTLYDPRFESLVNVTMLVMGGVASSAMVALMPWSRYALCNLLVLLLPSIVVCFISDKTALAVTILLYMAYISVIGMRSAREYRRAFDIEIRLQEQTQALEERNQIDSLTGIYNRGHFNNEMENFVKIASRKHMTGTLLMIDIDHFKAINDSYGHLFGDQCIMRIANIIQGTAKRDSDMVARFGGEEFAVLLRGCHQEHGLALAESIRENVEKTPFSHDQHSKQVTVSIGLASVIPTASTSPNDLIQRADEALYQAKKAGRNRVVVAQKRPA